MNIRNVSIKDYKKIKILLKRHNMNMIDFKRWVNLWKKNPSLKNNKIKWIKGWVIEKNNKVVGHIGHFPMQYFLNKKPYLCSVIYGWAVDEKFRSLSIVLLVKNSHGSGTSVTIVSIPSSISLKLKSSSVSFIY